MINQALTQIYKKIILDNALYDTGALYRSIQVDTNVIGNHLHIHIYCEDYIKYHIESYRLNEQFTNAPGFGEAVSKLFVPYFTQQATSVVQGGTFNLDVKVTIAYNDNN